MVDERAGVPWGLKRTARDEVSARLGTDVADLVVAGADVEYPVMAGSLPVTRWGARHLLRIGAYAVALYRALLEQGVAADAATVLVSDVVFAAIRPSRDALVAVARLRHRNRLRRALWLSRMAQRFYYVEPDWKMSDVPVEGGFGMDVTRCVVAEYFDSLGMAEFCQRVICDQDVRDAAHRGIDFERKGTLAGGASRCDFRYHVRSVGAR
jgi:ubiquinone biosynthesis protein